MWCLETESTCVLKSLPMLVSRPSYEYILDLELWCGLCVAYWFMDRGFKETGYWWWDVCSYFILFPWKSLRWCINKWKLAVYMHVGSNSAYSFSLLDTHHVPCLSMRVEMRGKGLGPPAYSLAWKSVSVIRVDFFHLHFIYLFFFLFFSDRPEDSPSHTLSPSLN